MNNRHKLEKVTDMIFEVKEVSNATFLEMYISGFKVEKEVFMGDFSILFIDNCYLISPNNYKDYSKFTRKLEKESPLLAELR